MWTLRTARNKSRSWLALLPWAIVAIYAAATVADRPSWALTIIGDGLQFALMLVVCASFACHLGTAQGRARWFWALMTAGAGLWLCSQLMWSYYELWRKQPAPSPYAGDVVLFLHLVPMMAGLATVPHERTPLPRLIALSLAMVAVWWVFLYGFLVIPWQYVHFSAAAYDPAFNALYAIQNLTVIAFLAIFAVRASGHWRRLYVLLLTGSIVYTIDSDLISRFIQQKSYYTGSPYDLLFLVPVAWMASAAARFRVDAERVANTEEDLGSTWMTWAAIAGVISVPLLMACNVWSTAPSVVRDFRFLVGVAASIVLAVMLFAQQHILSEQRFHALSATKESLSQLAKAREELEYRATHDSMTGCLNRATVLVALERELARARREKTPTAVVLVDLDEFKRINDSFGHHAGDFAISFATTRMRECVRTHDYVGRYGGEEFLVVIPDCGAAEALEIAERIRRSISQDAATFDDHLISVTASCGVAVSDPAEESAGLLRRADLALYAAKRHGRNRAELAQLADRFPAERPSYESSCDRTQA